MPPAQLAHRMRILHTSDWHLGQTLHEFDRSFEHQCFLDWLLATIEAEHPDALLIAGDVFDNANPSAAAQHQLYRFLTAARARAPALAMVLVAGNHDSPGRLEAVAPLLDLFGACVVGSARRLDERRVDAARLVWPLCDPAGEVLAWCLAVPFLRPGDLPRMADADDAYLAGVSELYRQALEHACAQRQPGQPIIAMGHCHMAGGEISERSERRIVIGGAEALPAAAFGGELAYVALGHLHKAQSVGGQAHVRYCGSPLPMSFAEVDYVHQVLCVDFAGEQVSAIRSLPVPRAVALLRVPRLPAAPAQVLAELQALDLSAHHGRPAEEHPYLEVRVRLDAPDPGLRARIEAALEGQPVRLARIDLSSAAAAADAGQAAAVGLGELERLSPEGVFASLCEQKILAGAVDREALVSALEVAFAQLVLDPADGGVAA